MTNFKELREGQTVQLRDKRVMVIETIYKTYVKYEDDESFYPYGPDCRHAPSMVAGANSKYDIVKVLSKIED